MYIVENTYKTIIGRLRYTNSALKSISRRNDTDFYMVTLQQSGTHWLKMMLSHYICMKESLDYNFDSIDVNDIIPNAKDDISVGSSLKPNIRHAHHSYWFLYKNKKVLLLVRNLKDSLMSAYDKVKNINKLDIDFVDFLKNDYSKQGLHYDTASLNSRIRFMNRWYKYKSKPKEIKIVKYENMKSNTHRELKGIVRFMGMNVNDRIIKKTVKFCSRKNMKNLAEKTKGSHQYAVSEKKDRGGSGYLDGEEKEWFVNYIEDNLKHKFGYRYD